MTIVFALSTYSHEEVRRTRIRVYTPSGNGLPRVKLSTSTVFTVSSKFKQYACILGTLLNTEGPSKMSIALSYLLYFKRCRQQPKSSLEKDLSDVEKSKTNHTGTQRWRERTNSGFKNRELPLTFSYQSSSFLLI